MTVANKKSSTGIFHFCKFLVTSKIITCIYGTIFHMCTQTMAILLCNFIRINLIKLFEKYVVLQVMIM